MLTNDSVENEGSWLVWGISLNSIWSGVDTSGDIIMAEWRVVAM